MYRSYSARCVACPASDARRPELAAGVATSSCGRHAQRAGSCPRSTSRLSLADRLVMDCARRPDRLPRSPLEHIVSSDSSRSSRRRAGTRSFRKRVPLVNRLVLLALQVLGSSFWNRQAISTRRTGLLEPVSARLLAVLLTFVLARCSRKARRFAKDLTGRVTWQSPSISTPLYDVG